MKRYLLLLAAAARSVNLMPMADDLKIMSPGDLFLKGLNAVVFEFRDVAALDANHMVMMFSGGLKKTLPFTEMPLVGQPALF